MVDEFEELREDYAAKQAARERRRLQSLWAKMLPAPDAISLRWSAGQPKRGDDCAVEVLLGDDVLNWIVPGATHTLAGERITPLHEYKPKAEEWALWRWHTARGTPVNEDGRYQLEPGFKPPSMEWLDDRKARAA